MKFKRIYSTWEDPDFQQEFAERGGFPDDKRTSEQIDKIETLLHLHPPMRVLDLGCGNGRHSLEMARRGYQCVGIDVADSFIEQARHDAETRHLKIYFRLQRGCDLQEKEVYEFVLAYNHNLGFMSEVELSKHFRNAWRSLKPSGKLLLVFPGPKLVPGQSSDKTQEWEVKDGKFTLAEVQILDGYRDLLRIIIDTTTDEIKEFVERQKVFAVDEVKSILHEAGFKAVDCLKDLDGNPATAQDFGVFACVK